MQRRCKNEFDNESVPLFVCHPIPSKFHLHIAYGLGTICSQCHKMNFLKSLANILKGLWVYMTFSWKESSVNLYKPSILYVGHQPDQKPQNVESDQVIHCLFTEVSFEV